MKTSNHKWIDKPQQKQIRPSSKILNYWAAVLFSILLPYAAISKTTQSTNDKLNTNLSINSIDKDEIAMSYIQNNLFINWAPITDDGFGFQLNKTSEDNYSLSYNHTFKGIPWYSEGWTNKITMHIKMSYNDNNIFIEFWNIKIWNNVLSDPSELKLWSKAQKTIYDFEIIEWESNNNKDKSIWINTKPNIDKTNEYIQNKILKNSLSLKKTVPNIPALENTQITKLNDIDLWKDIKKEWERYYREIYFTQDNKYRTVSKIYFDKYWNLDTTTNDEDKYIEILWIKINFTINASTDNNKIELLLNENDLKALIAKIKNDRSELINYINTAKVWPNNKFTWFNKSDQTRAWSSGKKVRSFDTPKLSLKLIGDTYEFNRWEDDEDLLWFNTVWENISLKNEIDKNIALFFVSQENNNHNNYQIELTDKNLSIDKIKKAGENAKHQLPKIEWDSDVTKLLDNKDIQNTHSKGVLYYYNTDGSLVSAIKCKKEKNWTYDLQDNKTKINPLDLYNFSKFESLVSEVTTIQKELNILDIDIANSFKALLKKQGVKVDMDGIKVKNNDNQDVYYCDINDPCELSTKQEKNFEITKNEKLYAQTKETLEILKSKLEVVKKLSETKILRQNDWKTEDFTKFVWWGRGIGIRFIDQNDIINFITTATNKISIVILRWEWQETTLIYDLSQKSWKLIIKGKDKITIDWQEYEIRITDDFNILLNPIEIK